MLKKMRRAIARAVGALALVLGALLASQVPAFAQTCTTSAQYGICFYADPGTDVQNNVWNLSAQPASTQTLTANSVDNWSVTADMPAGNTQVVSYPDTNWIPANPEPMTYYDDIDSRFHVTLPARPGGTDDYEAAYDVWLGNLAGGAGAQEVMIWNDNHNQTPSGSDTGVTWTDPTTRDVYTIWASFPGNPVSLVADTNTATGSADIFAAINDLYNSGYITTDTLYAIDYGFEICSTSGAAENFSVSSYSLAATPAPGAPTLLTVSTSGVTVRATWSAGTGATEYQYQLVTPGGTVAAGPGNTRGTSAAISGTKAGSVIFQVRSGNASGWSPWWTASNTLTLTKPTGR